MLNKSQWVEEIKEQIESFSSSSSIQNSRVSEEDSEISESENEDEAKVSI